MFTKKVVIINLIIICFLFLLISCEKTAKLEKEEEKEIVQLEQLEKRYAYLVNISEFNNSSDITSDEYSYLYWLYSNEENTVDYEKYEKQLFDDFDISPDHLRETSFINTSEKKYIKPNDINNFKYIKHEILDETDIEGNIKIICSYTISEIFEGEETEFIYIYEYIFKNNKIISGKTISVE